MVKNSWRHKLSAFRVNEVGLADHACALFSRSTFAPETEIYFLGYRDDRGTSNFDRSAA